MIPSTPGVRHDMCGAARPRSGLLLLCVGASISSAPAYALDGTGSQPVPGEGAVTDPLVAIHPVRPAAGEGAVGVTMELAGPTLVLDVQDGAETSEYAVLDGIFGANLLASAGLGKRVGIGVAMPFWLATQGAGGTGAALGDLRVQAPIALIVPGARGAGLGVSVVPWLDAPTGNAARFLGRGAFGAGVLGVVGYGLGPVRGSIDLGLAGSGAEPLLGVDERVRFLGSAAVSWAVMPGLGVTAEADVSKPGLGSLAGEARLSGRGRLPGGVELLGGVAAPLATGAGTAALRLYAGIGYHFGKKTAPVRGAAVSAVEVAGPYELLVHTEDAAGAPLSGAVVTATRGDLVRTGTTDGAGEARVSLDPGGWEVTVAAEGRASQRRTLELEEDRFRAPVFDAVLPEVDPGGARLALVFTDVEGRAVEDARVRVDGEQRGLTGPGGSFLLEGIAPGERVVTVEAPGFEARAAVSVTAAPDAAVTAVVLDRPPGTVKLRVRSPAGVVADALVRFVGPEEVPVAPVGATGERDVVLAPGRWQVVVSSKGFGLQTRDLVVERDAVGLVVVDVLLAAVERGEAGLTVRVVDPRGQAVEGAEVLLDGRSFGRTTNGGSFGVEGLDPGQRSLQVRGARFRASAPISVELVEGTRDLLVQMEWLAGSVEVLARGPDGPVVDAAVRFFGPEVLAPEPLGADGRGFFSLAPGTWTAALSSGRYGLQSREVVVSPEETSLLVVDAVMRAAEAGNATLDVVVRDPTGAPVPGAEVRVDGLAVGTTSSGGSVRLEGLQPGKRKVAVSADLYEDAVLGALNLHGGENTTTAKLAWVPGMVRVRATGPDGNGVDALARLYGTEASPPLPLGADGERSFALAPGRWTVVISSEAYGVAQRDVEVRPGQKKTTELVVPLAPPPGDLATLLVEVVDPDGAPVAGARVRVGIAERVLDAGAGVIAGLPLASQDAVVEAEGYEPVRLAKLGLVAGAQERRFVLQPIPRAVRITVRGEAGVPEDAQVRLIGATRVSPMVTAGGIVEARLRPGEWQLLVSAGEYGAERLDLVVPPGSALLPVEVQLEKSRIEVTESSVLLRQQVRFRFNEAALTPESYPVLDELAATLRTDTRIGRIDVQGHTDAVGTEDYNVALSQRRADAVRDYLVSRGVERERLVATGYGTSRALAGNDSEAGRARNRRVQFEVVE